jgi:hypothetical protein
MEKSMYFNIQNRMLNDRNFHSCLINHIEDLNDKLLEEKFPGIKIGPILFPVAYLDREKIKKYISEINELNEIFENYILPGIKLNFGEFTKN